MAVKTFYYTDPLNDDFCATNSIKTKKIPKNFKYVRHGFFFHFWAFFLYYFLAMPIGYIFCKIAYRYKIVEGRFNFTKAKMKGYFIYGNHACILADVFYPTLITGPRQAYVLCSPDSISVPGITRLVMQMGGIPVPNTMAVYKEFVDCINLRCRQGHKIMIYPEAHEWPYYTGVRPFKSTSFRYPVSLDAPVFAVATTFHKRKGLRFTDKPVIHYHISEPFYPDKNLSEKDAAQKLRDQVYDYLVEKSKLNEVEYYKYIKVEEK